MKGQSCDLGEIIDVSATGIRIRLKAGIGLHTGDIVETTLHTTFACARAVLKIVWVRRSGLFSKQAGAQFIDPDPKVRQTLADMARSACDDYAPTLE